MRCLFYVGLIKSRPLKACSLTIVPVASTQKKFSSECDLVRPLSISSVLSFP